MGRRYRAAPAPSRRQWRGSGGEIEIGQNGAYGDGIGDEGDDAHRSTTGRADKRQDIATTLRAVPRAMREAQREDVRRPGAPPDEPATDGAPSCPEGNSCVVPCSRPSAMT